jgi:anthranilate synthase/aminodeoxychorismate synthase-like glutamine amidotransferase
MILLIDNYDSFTYNLYQYLCELGATVRVRRNDAVTLEEIARWKPSGIVLSPGPGRPEEAGRLLEIVAGFAPLVPTLGICLGHQALAQAFGGKVVRAKRLMHGKLSAIRHDGTGVFRRLPNPFTATRYHSLVVEPRSLPSCLRVTARSEDGLIMGLSHRKFPAHGVQFHPESIMTREGKGLLGNFLKGRT